MDTLGHFIKDCIEEILAASNLRIFHIIERVRTFQRLAKHERASSNCGRRTLNLTWQEASQCVWIILVIFCSNNEVPTGPLILK